MKKCPVLLVVSGFLTENDISWFNRIKQGVALMSDTINGNRQIYYPY